MVSLVCVGQNARQCMIQDYTNHVKASALPEGLVASVENAADSGINTVLCPRQIYGTCTYGWRMNGRLLINMVKLFT